MICAIHQPNFLPYLGFFDKARRSDVFIIYDTAQYSKNEFHNRNKIKTSSGPLWLTIPVSYKFGQKINQVKISNSVFVKKHLESIKCNYVKAPYFDKYFPEIERIYSKALTENNLSNFSVSFLEFFFRVLKVKAKIVKASDLDLSPGLKSAEAIVEICKKVKASEYLSGAGAREYLDEKVLKESGINLAWQSFTHPVYPQCFGTFLPNMSVLDAVFNVGPELENMLSSHE